MTDDYPYVCILTGHMTDDYPYVCILTGHMTDDYPYVCILTGHMTDDYPYVCILTGHMTDDYSEEIVSPLSECDNLSADETVPEKNDLHVRWRHLGIHQSLPETGHLQPEGREEGGCLILVPTAQERYSSQRPTTQCVSM